MSSARKTDWLKLNDWVGSDIPCRQDFVSDNKIIDNAIKNHVNDGTVHVNSDDIEKWNMPYAIGTYLGNGNADRTVDIGADFMINFGLVFAVGYTGNVVDFQNQRDYQFWCAFSNLGSMNGVSIVSGNQIRVTQPSSAFQSYEMRNFNQKGVTYVVIAFR